MDSCRTKETRLEELMPLIRERLDAGGTVRFSPRGISMLPMLRQGIDTVTLSPLPEKLNLPLYQRRDGKYILHRVVEAGDTYTCIGDNQFVYEYGLTHDQMIALFCVYFALGSRGVIDGAVAGDKALFFSACCKQAGIIAGILVCLTLVRYLRERLRADLERDWKRRLLHGLLHGEYEKVSRYHSAELLNRLNNDVSKVNDGVLAIFPSAASMITRLTAAVIVLGTLDLRFTLLIALLGGIVFASTALMRRKLKDLNKLVSEHDGKVSGLLQETMEKLLMVQAMDVSEEVEHRAENLMHQRYRVQRRRKNISLLTNTGISFMSYGSGFLALVWCAFRMLQGQMSFGSLTAVTQLVSQLQAPFVNLSGVLPQYLAMTAAAERLMELEEIQGEPAPVKETPEILYKK